MITVISAAGDDKSASFDLRFGRAAFFCVYNDETNEVRFVENEYKDAQGGAGTKAAEKMVELNANKVVSGHFGPKAKDLLDKFKIDMLAVEDGEQTVQQVIQTL